MANLPSEEVKVIFRDFDPNTTVLTRVNSTNWLDMKGYHRVMVIAFRTVGTGDAKLVLKASAAVTGTSSAALNTIGTTSCTGQLVDASNGSIGNPGCGLIVAEATWDDVEGAVADGRYISAEMEATTSTDEFGVAYLFFSPRYQTSGLTATGNSL